MGGLLQQNIFIMITASMVPCFINELKFKTGVTAEGAARLRNIAAVTVFNATKIICYYVGAVISTKQQPF